MKLFFNFNLHCGSIVIMQIVFYDRKKNVWDEILKKSIFQSEFRKNLFFQSEFRKNLFFSQNLEKLYFSVRILKKSIFQSEFRKKRTCLTTWNSVYTISQFYFNKYFSSMDIFFSSTNFKMCSFKNKLWI